VGLSLAATAVTVVGYRLLIPPWGSMGAAVATLVGFAFLAVVTCGVTQRIFPVRYEWGRLVGLLGLAAVLWLCSRAVPGNAWAWPMKAGLAVAWPWGLWQLGLVSAEEKQYVGNLLRETGSWLGHVLGARPAQPAGTAPWHVVHRGRRASDPQGSPAVIADESLGLDAVRDGPVRT
jgi:hypothetical protein